MLLHRIATKPEESQRAKIKIEDTKMKLANQYYLENGNHSYFIEDCLNKKDIISIFQSKCDLKKQKSLTDSDRTHSTKEKSVKSFDSPSPLSINYNPSSYSYIPSHTEVMQ